MTKSDKILKKVKEQFQKRGGMEMLTYCQILEVADNLSKVDEVIKWADSCQNIKEKDAQIYLELLCEALDLEDDYDPNDPESWDCNEDEYADRMSHLANKAHEASEGDR